MLTLPQQSTARCSADRDQTHTCRTCGRTLQQRFLAERNVHESARMRVPLGCVLCLGQLLCPCPVPVEMPSASIGMRSLRTASVSPQMLQAHRHMYLPCKKAHVFIPPAESARQVYMQIPEHLRVGQPTGSPHSLQRAPCQLRRLSAGRRDGRRQEAAGACIFRSLLLCSWNLWMTKRA